MGGKLNIDKLFSDPSLVESFNRRDPNYESAIIKSFEESRNIRIMDSSLRFFIIRENLMNALKNCAEMGKKIKIIIPYPFSKPYIQIMLINEGIEISKSIESDPEIFKQSELYKDLSDLICDYKKNLKSIGIEFRSAATLPVGNLIITDKICFFEPYNMGKAEGYESRCIGDSTLSLVFGPGYSHDRLIKNFDSIWFNENTISMEKLVEDFNNEKIIKSAFKILKPLFEVQERKSV